MITVEFKKDALGRVNGFFFSGHADFSEAGTDIVCAGVSTLAQTTALSLEKLLNLPVEVLIGKRTGKLDCRWRNDPAKLEKTQLLIQTMLLGLEQIQENYPDYLKVLRVEV